MNIICKDERFNTQISFVERHDGYREVGYKIEPDMFGVYRESGVDVNKDSAQYDICIKHNYNGEQQAAINLEKIKQIVEENAPDGISYTNISTEWSDIELYGTEFDIQIIAPMHHIDRGPLVKHVTDYMDECIADMNFTNAVAAISMAEDNLKQ